MKRKTLTREFIMDGWLKYHNTTCDEVIKKHPKEVLSSPKWFNLYPVTQEQHDEWYNWVICELCKKYKISKKAARRGFVFEYLNSAPSIKDML